ncbi:gamma-tubulin complex component protein, partial [Kipferlia bialata]
ESGDFFTTFIQSSMGELEKKVKDMSHTRVDQHLESALKMTTAQFDPHHERLRVEFCDSAFSDHLNKLHNLPAKPNPTHPQDLAGYSAITLTMSLDPIHRLVFDNGTMQKYEMLCRRLIQASIARHKLSSTFKSHHQLTKQWAHLDDVSS